MERGDERDTVVQQTQQLRQGLESMRHGTENTKPRFAILFCLVVGLLGIMVGYLVNT